MCEWTNCMRDFLVGIKLGIRTQNLQYPSMQIHSLAILVSIQTLQQVVVVVVVTTVEDDTQK